MLNFGATLIVAAVTRINRSDRRNIRTRAVLQADCRLVGATLFICSAVG